MISLALAKIVNLWSFFKVIKKYHYTNMRQSKQLCIRKTFCPNIVPVLTLMTHKNVYVSIICFRLCYFGVVTSYLILKHSSTLFDWRESVFAITCTILSALRAEWEITPISWRNGREWHCEYTYASVFLMGIWNHTIWWRISQNKTK